MMRLSAILAIILAASGCASTQKTEINQPPALSPVGAGYSGPLYPDLKDQSGFPSSKPVARYSLWNDNQSRLFTDPRALRVGDVLTVTIQINDRAKFKNESERKRTSGRLTGLTAGFAVAGAGSDASLDFKVDANSKSTGNGATTRSEDMNLLVAAIVSEVLPNGNLIISGSQEVRVNAEMRVLTIAGIVRPSDIGANNMISYERIAEARVSYGGEGRLTEVQQPTYGQQILDQVLPF